MSLMSWDVKEEFIADFLERSIALCSSSHCAANFLNTLIVGGMSSVFRVAREIVLFIVGVSPITLRLASFTDKATWEESTVIPISSRTKPRNVFTIAQPKTILGS